MTKLRLTGERKDLAAKIPKLIRFDTSKVRRLTLNLPVRTTIKLGADHLTLEGGGG